MISNNNPNLVDIKNMTDTDRFLTIYQGWRDTWNNLENHVKEESRDRIDLKSDVQTLNKLVITGDTGVPSAMEQLRTHQRFQDTIGKLAWMVIGAIIVQVISFIGIAVWVVAQISQVLK